MWCCLQTGLLLESTADTAAYGLTPIRWRYAGFENTKAVRNPAYQFATEYWVVNGPEGAQRLRREFRARSTGLRLIKFDRLIPESYGEEPDRLFQPFYEFRSSSIDLDLAKRRIEKSILA